MKFSDAVVLGSGLIEFSPWNFLSGGRGCLVGMALAAVGLETGYGTDRDKLFPWMVQIRVPECPFCTRSPFAIFGYFVNHLAFHMSGNEAPKITFEQAIAAIRKYEPADDQNTELRKTETTCDIETCIS